MLCGVLLFALVGCATTVTRASFGLERAPDQTLLNPNVDFTVLGLVSIISGKKVDDVRGIRAELLQETKKQYPNADWIVDITVTRQKPTTTTTQLFGSDESSSVYYIFEGLAIDFTE